MKNISYRICGKKVHINLYKKIDGKRELIGTLKEYTNNEITLELEEKEIKLNMKDIVSAKTVFDFEGGI